MESKSILTSVTFWGAVLSFLIPVAAPYLQKYGVPVPDSASLAAKVVGAITFVMTVYGRFRANGQPPVHLLAPSS